MKINGIEQLFDNRDPAPFRERDLDPDLVEYLIAASEDLSPLGPFKLVFWIAKTCAADEVRTGVRGHLDYELERIDRGRRRYRRDGQVALLIGVVLMVALLSGSQLLDGYEGRAILAVREGLAILSWVLLWRPVEALLYEWLPIRRERKVMVRLIDAPIDVRFGRGPA